MLAFIQVLMTDTKHEFLTGLKVHFMKVGWDGFYEIVF